MPSKRRYRLKNRQRKQVGCVAPRRRTRFLPPQTACVAEQHTLRSGRGRLKTDSGKQVGCVARATHAFTDTANSRRRKPPPLQAAAKPQTACVAEQHTLHSGRGRLKNGQRKQSRVCRQSDARVHRHRKLPLPQTATVASCRQTPNRVRCRATHPTQRQRPSENRHGKQVGCAAPSDARVFCRLHKGRLKKYIKQKRKPTP
ncbi:hypothetical protein [Kingella potus]|uniref:hypothetical protein n=1 Tax=Kingella potus TaxID=265175 RepID=UPI001FD300EB|nr:hypothetical protein [Kingella potus]UOP01466.1 hypothetical protein LVJ84_04515 [Kingella potus]